MSHCSDSERESHNQFTFHKCQCESVCACCKSHKQMPPPRDKMTSRRVHCVRAQVTTPQDDPVNTCSVLTVQVFRDACNLCSETNHQLNKSPLVLHKNVFMSQCRSFVSNLLHHQLLFSWLVIVFMTTLGSLVLASIPLADAAPSSPSSFSGMQCSVSIIFISHSLPSIVSSFSSP